MSLDYEVLWFLDVMFRLLCFQVAAEVAAKKHATADNHQILLLQAKLDKALTANAEADAELRDLRTEMRIQKQYEPA